MISDRGYKPLIWFSVLCSLLCLLISADYVMQMYGFFFKFYRNDLTRLNRVYVNSISTFHTSNVSLGRLWSKNDTNL